jgi:hypothetical protein
VNQTGIIRRQFLVPDDNGPALLPESTNATKRIHRSTMHCAHGTSGKNQTKAKPIELLVLGSPRCLGRGWTFDDLEENAGIGEEMFRRFFHKFIDFGSTALCNEFVVARHRHSPA